MKLCCQDLVLSFAQEYTQLSINDFEMIIGMMFSQRPVDGGVAEVLINTSVGVVTSIGRHPSRFLSASMAMKTSSNLRAFNSFHCLGRRLEGIGLVYLDCC